MNYTINYPQASGSNGQLPVAMHGQRTIVLTSPGQMEHHVNSSLNQQSIPMMMQVAGSSQPIFYYPTNKCLMNKSNGSAVPGQVIVAPVSPVQSGMNLISQNNNSPTTVSIHADTQHGISCSLQEVFNVQ